ncbi:hypothetical protein VTK73DRAFT_9846 [Phialemonium thermophilum]|uniref:Uncharacterized protein n=1 Tax=Phialemonium thermophilum TaxID=223376 RepID=A0ABR3VZU7_9PEZI
MATSRHRARAPSRENKKQRFCRLGGESLYRSSRPGFQSFRPWVQPHMDFWLSGNPSTELLATVYAVSASERRSAALPPFPPSKLTSLPPYFRPAPAEEESKALARVEAPFLLHRRNLEARLEAYQGGHRHGRPSLQQQPTPTEESDGNTSRPPFPSA